MGRKMEKNEKFLKIKANGEEIWRKMWKFRRLGGIVGLFTL